MTTVILAIVGILIAAAAALFVFFYGGEAFGESEVRAEAARLVTEGQQIHNATELFYQQEGDYPGRRPDGTLDGELAMTELLAKDYLTHVPVGAKLSNEDTWNMIYSDDGMIYSRLGSFVDPSDPTATEAQIKASENAMNVCREARKQLAYQDFQTVYKCDGSDYPITSWAARGTLPDNEPCCIR